MESIWVEAQMLLTGLFAIGFWEALRHYRERRKYRFQWRCPECYFSIRSNFPESVKTAKEMHRH